MKKVSWLITAVFTLVFLFVHTGQSQAPPTTMSSISEEFASSDAKGRLLSEKHSGSPDGQATGKTAVSSPQPNQQDHLIFLPFITKPTLLNSFEAEVLNIVNQERSRVGCGPVTANEQLVSAARAHSQDMAVNDFFSHTGSNGSSPWERVDTHGYTGFAVGENIAAGYSTATAVMEGWMGSPGHRDNILNCEANEIGIGYVFLANDTGSVNYHHYWTQLFGINN
ncbi:MAG: CAP domain-containing protein [Chloroflexota bacterium]